MPELTKLALNNKIVEMRKWVKQSRIHCINKLSRESKKLREKKGTDEQTAKNMKKAERFVEEVLIMKKLKDDEVSKFALVNEQTMVEITNDVNETPEKKALARLVNHKAVADKVTSFREIYPNWKNTIPLLLDTLGEKYKHKNSQKRASKKKKEIKTKSSPSVIKNSSGMWTVEQVKSVEEKSDPKKSTKKNEGVSNFSKSENHQEEKVPQKYFKEGSNETKKTIEKYQQYSKESTNCLETNQVYSTAEVPQNEIVGAVDPFFLNKNNTEYISISAKENLQSEEKAVDDKPRNFSRDVGTRMRKDSEILKTKNSYSKSPRFSKQSEPIEVDLHPSWEAKKKQTQIVKFQGKKIKFDDES